MKKIIITLLIGISVFLRLYNIELTARFTRDESSDLLAIKNIIQNKKITLIGPMDEGKMEVFSSLTYYLLLPFCLIFGYNPAVTAYGTAFYGISTIVLIALLLKKNWSYSIFILAIIFTPLLVSSRWAWNPYFIPFWQTLFLLVLFSKIPAKYFFSGVIMGFTIHQHWYAVFVVAAIGLIILLKDNFKNAFKYSLGILFSLLPFVVFDLTHLPGLFLTRMLYFSPLSSSTGELHFWQNLINNTQGLFQYLSGSQNTFGLITLLLTFLVIIFHRHKNNLWILPLVFQIVGLSLTRSPYRDHYVISAVIFYLFWLYQNRQHILGKILIFVLIIFNLINVPKIISSVDWTQNIIAQNKITDFIINSQKNDIDFNVVVLQSPDNTTKGLRFKDQLYLRDIKIKDQAEYRKIRTLYVITYEPDWKILSRDQAYEIFEFRDTKPIDVVKIPNSKWYVYKLQK